jgi:hypothetical protein
MVTVGLAQLVGFPGAIVIASVSVGLVGGVFVRRVLRWPVRPWVRRLFRIE